MEHSRTVKLKSWLLSFIIMLIPGINVIYLLCLSFGWSHYESKVTLARAILIALLVVCIVHVSYISIRLSMDGTSYTELFGKIKEYYVTLYNNFMSYIKSFNFNQIFNKKGVQSSFFFISKKKNIPKDVQYKLFFINAINDIN